MGGLRHFKKRAYSRAFLYDSGGGFCFVTGLHAVFIKVSCGEAVDGGRFCKVSVLSFHEGMYNLYPVDLTGGQNWNCEPCL